jgi:hypothetical protein
VYWFRRRQGVAMPLLSPIFYFLNKNILSLFYAIVYVELSMDFDYLIP